MQSSIPAQYRVAQARLGSARTLDEREQALRQMLAELPRTEATARLQAALKQHLARLHGEVVRRTDRTVRHVHVDPEGAAQVLLLGPPNAGKSSILALLTRAVPEIAEYPFTTTRPQDGLMQFENVQLQLVDLPAITAQHMDAWVPELARGADAALLVADPSTPGVLTGLEEVCDRLAAADLPLVGALPADAAPQETPLPTVLVINKTDTVDEADVEVLEELYGERFPSVRLSVAQRRGVQGLKIALWRQLQLVRVTVRKPGRKNERVEPTILPAGSTVLDLALLLYPDKADKLASARVWGGAVQGQRVGRDFELRDRDEVELSL